MTDALPAQIAGYGILRVLGEGASGRVYLARQSNPPRDVALKVLRTAALPAAIRLRFERESELLAGLEHPGIARLYASGVADTESGPLPWLAMEVVHGQELLRFAQERKLDLRARLALLAQVCRTVHFAHTRGVIHRDLKPANILVDGDGRTHVLDFGVAHLVREDARMTVAGEVLGTVPYMSAEQLAGGLGAGDPRSDVYSLGVIAYELLSGELPYPGLSRSTVIEALAMIREGRVERLSRHLPAARGDAETVVMKAMAQEAPQRYDSAAELAGDIDRFLAREPISARPPTAGYLIGLFVRRHRALSFAAAVAVLAMIIGTLVSVRFAIVASTRAAESAAVNAFVEKMLTASAPDEDLGRDLRVRELLDSARASLGGETNPTVAASLYRILGATYLSLAETDIAVQLLDQARAWSVKASGAGSRETREIAFLHAQALVQQTHFADAERELAAVAAVPPATQDDWRLHVKARREMAVSAADQGNAGAARKMLDVLLPVATRQFGAEDSQTLVLAADRAAFMQIDGDAKDAVIEQRRLFELQKKRLGPDDPETLDVEGSLSVSLADLDQWDEAIALAHDELAHTRRIYGDLHPTTLIGIQNLGSLTAKANMNEESLGLRKELLKSSLARFGPNHQRSIAAFAMMGNMQSTLGQTAEAEASYRKAIEAGATDPALATATITPRSNLATLYVKNGRLQEARAVFESVIADAVRVHGEDNWGTAAYRANFGDCLAKLGDLEAARAQLEPALKVMEQALGHEHDRTVDTRRKLRDVYVRLHREDLAKTLDGPPA